MRRKELRPENDGTVITHLSLLINYIMFVLVFVAIISKAIIIIITIIIIMFINLLLALSVIKIMLFA